MIHLHRDDGTAVLTLSNPLRGNALSADMVESLMAQVQQCIADTALHTLVLRGEGKHFCTGFDLSDDGAGGLASEASALAAVDGPLLWRFVRVEQLLSLVWHAPLRTVAMAQGRTWGAGADLFAACDLRLADAETQWRFPGAGFGLVLGTRRLGTLVGASRALDWVGHGRGIDAPTAQACGFLHATVDIAEWRTALPDLKVERNTYASLKAATRPDLSDADLAALVRSAAQPGLAARVQTYRAASRSPPKPGTAGAAGN
jgi:enoyl-CoA hydratase/carnithine racemase